MKEAVAASAPMRSRHLELTLRSFRSAELRCRRRPSTRVLLLDLVSRVAPLLLGYSLMFMPSPIDYLGVALFAVATVSLLGSWFHDGVHGNIPWPKLAARLVERLGAGPLGISPLWWQYKHVRMHHRYVSNPEFDPDIQFGLLARVSVVQNWSIWHRSQHFHMWFLMPLATLNMLKPNEVWYSRRYRKYKEFESAPSAWVFLVDKYITFAVVWLPLFVFKPLSNAILDWTLFMLMTGTLASLITQVQHNTELAIGDEEFSTLYPLCEQLVRTTDVGVSKGIWWWLCGGVNFHIMHHVAPTLSFRELPEVTERLKLCLLDAGVELPVHQNIFVALVSHARLLRKLARRP
ncbi:fatty acid desaturase [Amycolatopsis sp. NPDC005961]|uniref:fatty acid desaturase family protein n=1 Tax=Amycolatopsis sp. NPDC005961 TaxID=3156720 RepID=UPI0033D83906